MHPKKLVINLGYNDQLSLKLTDKREAVIQVCGFFIYSILLTPLVLMWNVLNLYFQTFSFLENIFLLTFICNYTHICINYTYNLYYLKYVFEFLTFKNIKSRGRSLNHSHFRVVISSFHSELSKKKKNNHTQLL